MLWNKAKALTRSRWPMFYQEAQRFRDQVWVEMRVLKQTRVKTLMSTALKSANGTQAGLPIQKIRRMTIPINGTGIDDAKDLPGLQSAASGAHAVYLNPEQFRSGVLGEVAKCYPPNAGIKIARAPGDASNGRYVFGPAHGHLQKAIVSGHRQLLLAANRMLIEGVGPKILDLVELDAQGKIFTAYVVEHCEGEANLPTSAACVQKLQQLVDRKALELVAPDGFAHADFSPPGYGDNIKLDATGIARYVDFQNFLSANHERLLKALARDAAEATHFGDRSLFRGGKYLYQSIPGLEMGKRNVSDRMRTIDSLLAQAGTSLDGRIVFDFGCNIGMMMAEYLRRGARWTCGWDLPTTVVHSEKLLHAIGCTRFSLAGRQLTKDADVENDVPQWLRGQMQGLVISYLAVNGHFGWLDALSRLPWTCLIYEGHEANSDNDGAEAERALHQLAGARLAASARYEDGDSRARCVAIFVRDLM